MSKLVWCEACGEQLLPDDEVCDFCIDKTVQKVIDSIFIQEKDDGSV